LLLESLLLEDLVQCSGQASAIIVFEQLLLPGRQLKEVNLVI
jgi:hypothetical protein